MVLQIRSYDVISGKGCQMPYKIKMEVAWNSLSVRTNVPLCCRKILDAIARDISVIFLEEGLEQYFL